MTRNVVRVSTSLLHSSFSHRNYGFFTIIRFFISLFVSFLFFIIILKVWLPHKFEYNCIPTSPVLSYWVGSVEGDVHNVLLTLFVEYLFLKDPPVATRTSIRVPLLACYVKSNPVDCVRCDHYKLRFLIPSLFTAIVLFSLSYNNQNGLASQFLCHNYYGVMPRRYQHS